MAIELLLLRSYFFRQMRFVTADEIVITGFEDSPRGLIVTFFVRGMSGGLIRAQTVLEAVEVFSTRLKTSTFLHVLCAVSINTM